MQEIDSEMVTKLPEEVDLQEIESRALERLSEEGLGRDEEAPKPSELELEPEGTLPVKRLAAVITFPILAASVMSGAIFIGFGARIYAAIAGILGILVAIAATRIRKPWVLYLVVVGGIFGIGVLFVLPTGFGNIWDLGPLVKRAVLAGDVNRPPVLFEPGWHAIAGWLLAGLGFAAGWVAIELKRPALGLLVPLPLVAFTAISVPDEEQVANGIVALVLFAIGLGLLSGTELAGEDDQRRSLAYEARRAVRALPMVGGIVAILFLLSQTNVFFPAPLYDPTQEAKKPKPIPLSEVKDRPLFHVKSSVTGPWRMGHLDVYDEGDGSWRLPPFAQSRLKDVPRSGVVDSELVPGVKATFSVKELGGAVLPGLPNTVGIVAVGPKLAFDGRLGNIRLTQGTIEPGLEYTVVAAQVPPVEDLMAISKPLPEDIQEFLEIPEPPPAVVALMRRAPNTSLWAKLDFMRNELLDIVSAKGSGSPVEVTPEKVQDLLAGSKEGNPFEIVAAQAMLARWAGVPSRIGYGFDGGICVGEDRPPPCSNADVPLEVRPRNGASFMEVYFSGFGWLPVIGTPRKAESSVSDSPQQYDPSVAATDEIAVRLVVPIALDARTLLYQQIRRILQVVVPVVLLILAMYYSWPGLVKAVRRSRRRSWAEEAGPTARIAVAYADWRDVSTDFGYKYDSDTPLMFLDRIVEDEEHTELAWLVTRTLWGDLRPEVTDRDALAAEELSKSLRRRLAQGHPATLRAIALFSRLSLRYPYALELGPHKRRIAGEVEPAFSPAAS